MTRRIVAVSFLASTILVGCNKQPEPPTSQSAPELPAQPVATPSAASSTATAANSNSFAGMMFEGQSTPQGSAPWDVKINFETGKATWDKGDGAHAERTVSSFSRSNEHVSLSLEAKSPVGIPDLTCTGLVSGETTLSMDCKADAGGPPEKISGVLHRI